MLAGVGDVFQPEEPIRWIAGDRVVTLTLDGFEETRSVFILKDEWWRERR